MLLLLGQFHEHMGILVLYMNDLNGAVDALLREGHW